VTSGLRIGTPAVTTRGFKVAQEESVGYTLNSAFTRFGGFFYARGRL
jgi:glycine/serine hydroxymethyltransferase